MEFAALTKSYTLCSYTPHFKRSYKWDKHIATKLVKNKLKSKIYQDKIYYKRLTSLKSHIVCNKVVFPFEKAKNIVTSLA